MLEARELLDSLKGRPNPTAVEVRQLGAQYRAVLDQILAGQRSVDFVINEQPTNDEFLDTGWVWPYYRNLRAPIEVHSSRQRGKTVLELSSEPSSSLVLVRFEHRGSNPVLKNKVNLPFMYIGGIQSEDGWNRRRDLLRFGIDLANFALNHKPSPDQQTTKNPLTKW